MQTQKSVQLELPITPQKMDTLKHMEKAIQAMLDITWNSVITHIPIRTTKRLMSEHGKLIALHNGEALIRISSLPLYKIAQTKLPEIEQGFQKAFGVRLKVRLEAKPCRDVPPERLYDLVPPAHNPQTVKQYYKPFKNILRNAPNLKEAHILNF